MKIELKDFQTDATRLLLNRMLKASKSYYDMGEPASCCLSAPTGSGKTVMAAAAIEALFNGSPEWGIERDPAATVLWVSDSPSLNEQTSDKFKAATDLDNSLIETIENTFTGDHTELEPGHIYFLNCQKLSKTGLLTKGGEIPTFWDLLRRTVNDPSVHLYVILDEAHKGLGSNANNARDEKQGETIVGKIVDGEDGNCPIPVVVGISATPKRFAEAMANRSARLSFPIVKVSPADVQASGLLKDKIILQAPTDNADVHGIYLTKACAALKEQTNLWEVYCKANNLGIVRPLMVVQVPNRVSETTIRNLAAEIYEKVGWLDRSTAFAHVISGMGDLDLDPYAIPCVEPQDVQRKSDIRILFAKEAISTGWDCPRAEVIFSMRPHSDDTYIAQLIGRMVRTPLAYSVDIEVLNSVSCYLPYFDPSTLQKVVKYLTEEGSDDFSGVSSSSGREVVTNPVDVKWDSSFGIDYVFISIASKERGHNTANYINGCISFSEMLDENEIENPEEPEPNLSASKQGEQEEQASTATAAPANVSIPKASEEGGNEGTSTPSSPSSAKTPEPKPSDAHSEQKGQEGEYEKALNRMLRNLNEAMLTYADELESARDTVRHARSEQVTFAYMDSSSVQTSSFTDDADARAINNARRRADVALSQNVANAYFRQEMAHGKDPIEINTDIAAAAAVPEIVDAVKSGARETLEKLTEKYDSSIAKQPPAIRNKFTSAMVRHGIPHTVYLDKPIADKQDKSYKAYPKHVVNDPETHLAYFNLLPSEDAVVMHELKNPNVVAWYRNPTGKSTPHSLRIPYRISGERKSLHPDFIFFERVDGVEMPSVVDPHGLHLSDTMPKLKGMANYVEEFGDIFHRFWFVSDYNGQACYIDIKDPEVRSVIRSAEDGFECFKKCGKKYMGGTLG